MDNILQILTTNTNHSKTKSWIHFIGIGGVGMSALAKILADLGFFISGSDLENNNFIHDLLEKNIKITLNHCASNLDPEKLPDLVVKSSAINAENVELKAAQKHNLPIITRGKMLAYLTEYLGKKTISVAGSHGKTTTASLISEIFLESSLNPTCLIGARLNKINSNAILGDGDYTIIEADESDASFLHLAPNIGVITNIDNDHLTSYNNDLDELLNAFIKYASSIHSNGACIVCVDCPLILQILPKLKQELNCKLITYSTMQANNNLANLSAKNIEYNGAKAIFELSGNLIDDLPTTKINLNLPGVYNISNALAAIAAALYYKIDLKYINSALESFKGTDRRFNFYPQIKFQNTEFCLIDDYGHHPNEIDSVIDTVRNAWPNKRLVMLFQPHRYTRTRDLFNDFVKVLAKVDNLLLLDVYPASEKPIAGADSNFLLDSINSYNNLGGKLIGKISNAKDVPQIVKKLFNELEPDDLLIIQGAGSIGQIAECLVSQYSSNMQ